MKNKHKNKHTKLKYKSFDPTVYPRINSKGEITSYRLDCGLIDGKRRRFRFDTEQHALARRDELIFARQRHGDAIFTALAADAYECDEALRLLAEGGNGYSIIDAVRFFLRHEAVALNKKSVMEVLPAFIASKKDENLTSDHIKKLGSFMTKFGLNAQFVDRPIHEIQAPEIETWLKALNVGASTRNGYMTYLMSFYHYAKRMQYCLSIPIYNIPKAKIKNSQKPGILTVSQCRALLLAAEWDFLPTIALGLFAGLRPISEMHPLEWSSIYLLKGRIAVNISKNLVSHRFVRMMDNLVAWLEPYSQMTGKVSFKHTAYYQRLKETRLRAIEILLAEEPNADIAALVKWPSDCMRHTYASNFYEYFSDGAILSKQMGHSQRNNGNMTMLEKHYLNRVLPEDAEAFWNLYPPSFAVTGSNGNGANGSNDSNGNGIRRVVPKDMFRMPSLADKNRFVYQLP